MCLRDSNCGLGFLSGNISRMMEVLDLFKTFSTLQQHGINLANVWVRRNMQRGRVKALNSMQTTNKNERLHQMFDYFFTLCVCLSILSMHLFCQSIAFCFGFFYLILSVAKVYVVFWNLFCCLDYYRY